MTAANAQCVHFCIGATAAGFEPAKQKRERTITRQGEVEAKMISMKSKKNTTTTNLLTTILHSWNRFDALCLVVQFCGVTETPVARTGARKWPLYKMAV